MSGNNKGLTINLSFLASDNQNNNNNNNNNNPASSKSSTTTKSPKNFEEPNGAVGLGILAAMNESDPNANPTNDLNSSAKSSRGPILSVSPRSIPIPIWSPNSGKSGVNSPAESEEYTCVISHIGNNLIKKCEYFDGDLGNGSERTTTLMVGNGVISASSSPSAGHEAPAVSEFEPADFLNSCYLCEKELHGLDIFMYRGEKAFCSAECRDKQIASDERREKRSSGVKKPLKYSVSPCSDQLQFLAGVAAA